MKQFYLKTLVLVLFCMVSICVHAYDAEIDGIYYDFDTTKKTATVAQGYYNAYSDSVSIPSSVVYNGDSYSVTSIGLGAFLACSGLTSVIIPNSVTSIDEWAFAGCSGLISVTIPDNVTSIGKGAFSDCSGLTSVTIPNSVTYLRGEVFYGCSSLTAVTIPNSVTSIGGLSFGYCRGLTSITIPNSVTSIEEGAFRGCSGLISVTIGNSVATIETKAFAECSGLSSLIIPNSVTFIGRSAFMNCSGLTSLTIPNSVTNIRNNAFSGCGGLEQISVEAGNNQYDSRNNCNAIIETESNTLITGCKNTVIPNSVTSIGESAFSGCVSLTSITIPNSVTRISSNVFTYCSGLKQIAVAVGNNQYDSRNNCNAIIETESNTLITGCKNTVIPNSVTSIGNSAFAGCSSLASVAIPNSVTSIGGNAFKDCSGLASLIIPNSVTSISYNAFANCNGLQNIYSLIEIPFALDDSAFDVNIYATVPLYVPQGRKNLYQQAEGWKLFQNIGEGNPLSIGITTAGKTAPTAFYSVSGRQAAQSQKGLNIIRTADGRTVKVMKK
jgi:hypothetical protein